MYVNGRNGLLGTSMVMAANQWYFIAGGWDGTNIKVSVNGAPFQTAPYSAPIPAGNASFMIGLESGSGAPLHGRIEEVGVRMRRCLTQSEVGILYNGGAGLPVSSF